MKITTIYSDKEGILRACVEPMPVPPEVLLNVCPIECGQWLCKCQLYADKCREYRETIQRCKDTSVPFQDINAAAIMLYKQYRKGNIYEQANWNIEPDTLYSVQEFECEIKTMMSEGWQPTYNNPDNSGCEATAEPMDVAIIIPLSHSVEPIESNEI